ncbi:GCR1-dependent translation factor 1 [Lecanora helva]
MRTRQTPTTLLILLLSYTSLVAALLSTEEVVALADGKKISSSADSSVNSPSKPAADGVGTKDAPVDGKDGRPHLGPFVETSAERDRKKAKESGEETKASKPIPSAITGGGALSEDVRKMPETNDGVMDDPNRTGPKEGTRGTEGGISEKSKDGKEGQSEAGKTEKKPDPPKEIPPLPHSEQENLGQKPVKDDAKKGKETGVEDDPKSKDNKQKELGGLEKPADLPQKPHDIPHPAPESASKKDPLAILKPFAPSFPALTAAPASIIQPLHSFVLSLTMIIFSEIGDKTFLIAALMAMKHPRLVVFSAAFTALIAMTILSAVLGHAVPTLIPKRFTNLLAALLFLVFGARMLREGYAIPPEQGVSEEMKEVEMELEEKEELARKMGRRRSSISPYILEAGRVNTRKTRSNTRLPAPPDSPPSSPDTSRSPSPGRASALKSIFAGVNNLFSLLLSPAWVQTFVMTFLGEWGDRSQIATIAMAAGQDYWWVTGGAVSGHAFCTAIAVIGGRAIAGRVSLRIVTLGGGFAFLVFGIIYLVEAMYIV